MDAEMKVKGVLFSPFNKELLLGLELVESEELFLMRIDAPSAEAIQMELQKVETLRPQTHDLMKSVISAIGATLQKILILYSAETTMYAANLYLKTGDAITTVDARPADAIALAVRMNSPIYIDGATLERSREQNTDQDDTSRDWFESLDPNDLLKE